MKYINVAGLSKPVSNLMLGTDYFKPDLIDQISVIMDDYVSAGGNSFDTGFVYSGGLSEEALGMWVEQRKNRDQVVVLTKGAHHDANGPRVTPEAIEHDLMISLERLKMDYVDMYALHRDDPAVPVGPIIEALNKHIEEGRIRAIGGSNWSHQRLQEANEYAEKHGLIGFAFSSPNLSLAKAKEPFWKDCVSADSETCAWHERHQMPLFSWSSQARGFFTGLYTPDDRSNADLVRVFYSDDNWERYRRAEQMAHEKGVSLIQIALAYVLNQPYPTCALIGPRNKSEIDSCNEATSIELTRDEMEWLDLTKR